MKNNLTFFFKNKELRTVQINGEPYFVGKDVANILGYSRTADAIKAHVEYEDKGVGNIQTPGGNQNVVVINESGLYSLILSSKMPNAKKFKHWVTSEVLPAIRQHGAYMTDAKAYEITHDQTGNSLADLLQQAADQLKRKDLEIKVMTSKARFADAVRDSPI